MSPNSVKISFYFPEISRPINNKSKLFDLIVKEMRKDGNIKRAGYLKEKDFLKELIDHIGNNTFAYKNLSSVQKKIIRKKILSAVRKSDKTLPHPDLPIFIFVYPWFPNSKDRVLFQGVNAFAAHYTLHLFLDLSSYTKNSLQQTVAHEWNHMVFYRYHVAQDYPLYVHIIMEGLAEVFREEVVGGSISPWASALTNTEAKAQLKLFSSKSLARKGMNKIYREVFFGSKKYKRWTGYSIGYWLAKEFRKMKPNLSWEEIIKTKPEDILKPVKNRA